MSDSIDFDKSWTVDSIRFDFNPLERFETYSGCPSAQPGYVLAFRFRLFHSNNLSHILHNKKKESKRKWILAQFVSSSLETRVWNRPLLIEELFALGSSSDFHSNPRIDSLTSTYFHVFHLHIVTCVSCTKTNLFGVQFIQIKHKTRFLPSVLSFHHRIFPDLDVGALFRSTGLWWLRIEWVNMIKLPQSVFGRR